MTQHDPTLRLRHMLDHAREAVNMARDRSRSDLYTDRMLELALVRLVEVVGEAASRVSREDQARYVSIPWAQVVGMRHRLIQGYDTVDLQVLWDTVAVDLPPFFTALEETLEPPERSGLPNS